MNLPKFVYLHSFKINNNCAHVNNDIYLIFTTKKYNDNFEEKEFSRLKSRAALKRSFYISFCPPSALHQFVRPKKTSPDFGFVRPPPSALRSILVSILYRCLHFRSKQFFLCPNPKLWGKLFVLP